MRRRIPAPEAAARSAWLAVAVAGLLCGTGCAKKGPPTGGPPDLDPPRIDQTSPDSGASSVPRDAHLAVTFSEGMEPRGTGDAVELAPRVGVKQRRWSGRTLTLVLAESLRADHTYTMFVGGGARDRHGNNLVSPRAVVFTTAAKFPAGRIEGEIDPVGFDAAGTLLWCYRDGRTPDSTARDFDALGVADLGGDFRIGGLAVPATWRVWAFVDLNRNRSFEPTVDLLVGADTSIVLTEAAPAVTGIHLHVLNPHAPGRFAGTIVDTLGDTAGLLRLIVTAEADTSRHLLYDIAPAGGFDFKWDPGVYHVRAFRDLDRNKAWRRDTEPASGEVLVRLTPGGEVVGMTFVLARPLVPEKAP